MANYTFNPISTGTPTTSANNHPNLFLNGYVGGLMVTATSTNYTKPYIVTNVSGSPGDVGIYLPGDSSEMLAFFNVGSRAAPTGGLTSSSYVFGGLDVAGVSVSGLNTARGTYVSPSNFAARAAAIFNDGANTPISTRDGASLSEPGGYANQQMVTAESVGANTSAFLTSISSVPVTPCACESTQWGFWSAYNGKKDSSGNLIFEDQGNLLLWVAGVPTSLANLPTTGTATYTGHAIANIANPNNITSYLAAGTFSALANFGTRNGAVTIGGLDGTNYTGTATWIPTTASFNGTLTGTVVGRTATLAGSFFQGGPSDSSQLYGEMGGSLILNGTQRLSWKRDFPRQESHRGAAPFLLGRGGQRLERGGDRAMREVGRENRQTLGLVAVRVNKHDRAAPWLLPQRQPGVRAERNQVVLADRLHQRIARDETGEAEEQRRGLAVGDQKPFGVKNFLVGVDALREQEVRIVRQLAAIRVMIGVIRPEDVQRAGIALIDEPAEIVEVMDKPEARN